MRVLLIDDEVTIREVLCTALSVIAGHEVLACGSAREALTQAEDFAPDLLLIDLMMPELDGIATLQAIRQLPGQAAVPAVFISATADPQLLARAQTLQPRAILRKPLDVVTIGATLERLCRPG